MNTGIREIDVLKGKLKARWSGACGRSLLGLLAFALGGLPLSEVAADLIVLCPRAVETAVSRIADDFHAQGGTRVQFVLGTAGDLSKRAAAGERADIVIGTTQGLGGLEQSGAVVKETRAELGRVGVGVAVKTGAPRPDISTPEALRQTLLKAASLGYADPARGGTGGTHFAGVLERLGIAEAVSPKTRLYPQGVQALEAVARGEIELAVTPTSEIVVREGLLLVGPLPGDLQSRLSYSAGVLTVSPSSDAAKAFVARLVNSEGRQRFIAAGFEPPESPTKTVSPR